VDNSDIELSDEKFVIFEKNFRSDLTVILSGGNFNDQLMTAIVIQCTMRYWDRLCFGRFIVTFPWLIAMRKMLSGNYVVNLCQCSWTQELNPVLS
jgi:hypothetical protein